MKTWTKTASIVTSTIIVAGLFSGAVRADDIPGTFTGGHDIGTEDHGRPCVLIAAALGVKTEVFREAFSGVTPAKNGKPSGDEARKKKEVLVNDPTASAVGSFTRYNLAGAIATSTELVLTHESGTRVVITLN